MSSRINFHATMSGPMLAVVIVFLCTAQICLGSSYPLDTACSPPRSLGGLGWCGPAQCSNTTTTKPGCVFTARTADISGAITRLACRQCTQSSKAMCSGTALKSVIVGSAVKAAFCTDKHLVIITTGAPSWTPNLDDVPNPPGSVDSTNTQCVTRTSSLYDGISFFKVPLTYTLLATAATTNNMANFPAGAADSETGYMSSGAGAYGLPTRGSVGVSVGGQDIFPVFNNRAELTPDSCESDSCNEHVGGGGGQPHLHGDPFGSWCLYSQSNYSSLSAHPPQIGWGLDGPAIFGRYLATDAPGYSTALDMCGGHDHDAYGYHYHTQVIDAVTTYPAHGMASGIAYAASTPGVYKCWRGDISTAEGFWTGQQQDSTYYTPCCSSTEYYTFPGITLGITSSSANKPPPAANPPPADAPAVSPPAPSTSSSTTSGNTGGSFTTSVTVTLAGETKSTFTSDKQLKYRQAVATTLGTSSSNVAITQITDTNTARRSTLTAPNGTSRHGRALLAAGIAVDTQITTPTAAEATAAHVSLVAAASSSSNVLSAALQAQGLTGVTVKGASSTSSSDSKSNVALIAGIAGGVGGVVLIAIIIMVIVLVHKRNSGGVAPITDAHVHVQPLVPKKGDS